MHTRRPLSLAVGLATMVCLIVPAGASAAPLRGWWPMNERSGQTIVDWSGNRNHGMLGSTAGVDDNDPTRIGGIFGFGSALRFDGNDFVRIPDDSSLRPERLTLSTWFRAETAPSAFKYLLAKGSDACNGSSFALYTTAERRLAFYIYGGGGEEDWVRSPEAPDSVWDGRWHHAAGTYDGRTVRLYIDGRQVGTGTPAEKTIEYDLPDPGLAMGAYEGSCSMFLTGDLDGVSLWDRALPIEDISRIVRSLVVGR